MKFPLISQFLSLSIDGSVCLRIWTASKHKDATVWNAIVECNAADKESINSRIILLGWNLNPIKLDAERNIRPFAFSAYPFSTCKVRGCLCGGTHKAIVCIGLPSTLSKKWNQTRAVFSLAALSVAMVVAFPQLAKPMVRACIYWVL